jgi:hypothetical protein
LAYDFKKLNRKFDLIFIDGDHSYNGVKNDTKIAFELLRDEQAIIVWHDYARMPDGHERQEVIQAILAGTPDECKKYLYRVSNTLCAIFCRKELPAKYDAFPSFPNKIFQVSIKAEKYDRTAGEL